MFSLINELITFYRWHLVTNTIVTFEVCFACNCTTTTTTNEKLAIQNNFSTTFYEVTLSGVLKIQYNIFHFK